MPLFPSPETFPSPALLPEGGSAWPGQASATGRPQVHIVDGRGFAIRHVRPGPGEGAATVDVLDHQMGFEWLPMSTLPTSPDLVEGTYTRRLGDAGEFTLRFPNAASSRGLWREKFHEAGALEWIEIYRAGVLEFAGVIQRVEVTRGTVTVSGGDGWELLKRAYERDRTWNHAPADVIDHYTQVWVEELHEDWSDTSAWTVGAYGTFAAVNGQGVMAGGASETVVLATRPIDDIDGDWEIETGVQVRTDPFGLGVSAAIDIIRSGIPSSSNGVYINNRAPGGTSRSGRVTPDSGLGTVSVLGSAAGDINAWSLRHQIRIRRVGRWLMAWIDGQLIMAAETGTGSLGHTLQIVLTWVGPSDPGSPENPSPANTCTATWDPITLRRLRPFLRRGTSRGDLVLPGDHPTGGLRGRYHNLAANSGFASVPERRVRSLSPVSEPYGQRLDETIDTSGGLSLPLKPGAADDWFGVRWTGSIWLPLAVGAVQVRLLGTDDAGRLWIRDTRWGRQVADGWYGGPGTSEGTFTGEADGWYPIVVEMVEDAGVATITLQVRGRGWTDPGGAVIPADTWTTVPSTSLSPLGCHEARIQGQSHFAIVQDVAQQAGYQLLFEPMSLESGEFPGRLVPRLRVGRDTDVVLEVEDSDAAEPIMEPTVTRDSSEQTTRLIGAGSGTADGRGSQTMVEVADHATASLFDLEAWVDAGDASLPQLLEARANAELALRNTPWEEVRGVPRGLERLADTWPLTGQLSAMRWRPGDGLRVSVPEIGVRDRECRQLTQVTRQFAAEGRTGTQVAWRQRPRSAAAALRRLALSQALGQRSYQPQHQTLVSSYISTSVAAGATTDYAIIPLQPQDDVVRAVVRASLNPGGGTLGIEINGLVRTTELGGGWVTVPLEIDITPFATQASASDNRLYVRLSRTGGSTGVIQFQTIVQVLR